jgi:transposase
MLKSAQLAELAEEDFHFITAITKPQIESLIKKDIFQLEMFDNTLVEVEAANIRYILRRNPIRAAEIDATRKSKLKRLNKLIDQQNVYLVEHPRAHVSTAVKKVQRKAAGLKIDSWVEIKADKRILAAEANEDNIMEISRLDGCYVIKSDLPPQLAPTKTVHDRYKGLAEVEFAFRTMKTTLLEMRGIFVRKANRTRAHVFVIMLAYSLAYQLRRLWFDVELTVEEGISELASICAIELTMHNQVTCQIIPNPRPLGQLLLEKTNITLPDVIPHKNVTVDTRKKLVSERKSI